jgi:hypothetical protein
LQCRLTAIAIWQGTPTQMQEKQLALSVSWVLRAVRPPLYQHLARQGRRQRMADDSAYCRQYTQQQSLLTSCRTTPPLLTADVVADCLCPAACWYRHTANSSTAKTVTQDASRLVSCNCIARCQPRPALPAAVDQQPLAGRPSTHSLHTPWHLNTLPPRSTPFLCTPSPLCQPHHRRIKCSSHASPSGLL